MDLRACLHDEFERRRSRNPRYSVRGFARHLGTDHSVIGRLLAGGRLTPAQAHRLGHKLGLDADQIRQACLFESMALVEGWARQPDFRADTRWIATRTSLSIDDVNVALQLLLVSRRLSLTSTNTWASEGSA